MSFAYYERPITESTLQKLPVYTNWFNFNVFHILKDKGIWLIRGCCRILNRCL